ncbi:thioredoxin-like protein [Ampelomyces quisqualis]|uniref:Thioredoxin-like protein n=1 Tax=Ampelomyces quisqualis TaxID=50730 RepID=A0A6A5QCG0_AMPQU|nr:thioredoxin-like protein [Ampelomyces quisqualis]
MRSIFYTLLSLATLATTLAIEAESPRAADADDGGEEKQPDTVFNGQPVPPMIELTQHSLDRDISNGNWLVEFYSPSCPHCMHFKPTYQTAYEFYYTSKPVASKDEPEGDSLNSFTRYYDFKFAKVDCLAFADACNAHGIKSYPSLQYFTDGKLVKQEVGSKDMAALSKMIEQLLEAIRPGSRKEGGPRLPKAGDKAVEVGPETEAIVKEKEKEAAKDKKPVAKSTPTKAAKPSAAKPTSNANLAGAVETLTAAKFETLVTNSLEPWFIKFYAPWCHHCQALAPTWTNLARQMKGNLNIGEVNCDAEKKLCKQAGVQGYPTMLLFRGGERVEYDGLRGIGDLLSYADKVAAVRAGVQAVDAEDFKKMEEAEEVIFTYFYDHATTSEDFQALERLTLSLVGKAKLVKTNDADLAKRFKISTYPRLIVSRDGKPSYYPPITPKEMRDTKKILTWMKSVWLPIVPELTSSNAREIMNGKIVVLAVLSREHGAEFAQSKRELKNAAMEYIDKRDTAFQLERQELRDAKQLRIEEATDKKDDRALRDAKSIRIDVDSLQKIQVGFAWVDGLLWERWIKTTYGFDVKDGERVIINDEDRRRYWDVTSSGEPIRISRASILETISKVTVYPPKIAPKSTTGAFTGFFLSTSHFVSTRPFLSLGMVVAFFTVIVLFGKSRNRRLYSRGGFIHLNEKDGLLGSNGNGAKHD